MAIISLAKTTPSSGAARRNRLSRLYLDSGLAFKSKTFADLAEFAVFCWIIAIKKLAKNSTRRLSNDKLARNAAKHSDVFFSYARAMLAQKHIRYLFSNIFQHCFCPVQKMRIAVVVLPPAFGTEQVIKRRNGFAPRDFGRRFEKFGVLIHHAVNNRRKGFVTWK